MRNRDIRKPCILIAAVFALAACGKKEPQETPKAQTPAPQPPAAQVEDARPVIVAFGDSLTAGYGLEPGLSYADFLQKELDAQGYRYRVVNQGISGDTTDGGAARISDALTLHPKIVILELGANDGLRGLPIEATEANLSTMIDACQQSGAKVLLAGMTLPRNYGPDYIRDFEKVFAGLARSKKVALIPFFLEGVATDKQVMQADALHPTAEGTKRVAANVMKHLKPLLEK